MKRLMVIEVNLQPVQDVSFRFDLSELVNNTSDSLDATWAREYDETLIYFDGDKQDIEELIPSICGLLNQYNTDYVVKHFKMKEIDV